MNRQRTNIEGWTPDAFGLPRPATLRILLAEDDPALNQALTLRLANAGFQVTSAAEGRSALELTDTVDYDVVLLDLALPLVSGMKLLRRLGSPERRCGPSVVVLTGAEEELARHAECQGAFAVLRKPAPFERLVRTLCAAAARRAAA